MSEDEESTDDPLADRADDRSDDEFVDEWVETVESERDEAADENPADEDPFERIGEGTGPRHGDPFAAFEATGADEEPPTVEDSIDATGPDPARQGLPDGEGSPDDEDDPFASFEGVDGAEHDTDPFGDEQGAFASADTDDGVWERMESADSDAERVPGKRYVDVDKHSYCESCPHFSKPPEIECSHEGTEILEFRDVDTVRVVDCPIVAERRALEDVE